MIPLDITEHVCYTDGHGNVREVLAVSATGDTVTYRHLMNRCITIKLGAKHTCKRTTFAEWAVRRFAGEDSDGGHID